MLPILYTELVNFYHLLNPLEDHKDEGQEFAEVLLSAISSNRPTLLELGAGAGHSAYYMKSYFNELTLTDISKPMLALSKSINSSCKHLLGDMRDLRLSERFDCVFIHDAISYMQSIDDLTRVAETAFHHLKSNGVALVVPDCTKESFCDYYEDHAADDERRSLRCISWSYDPDPTDSTHITDFAFLLRENGEVRPIHDRHTFGLFAEKEWLDVWKSVGFQIEMISRPLPAEYASSAYTNVMLLCRKRV